MGLLGHRWAQLAASLSASLAALRSPPVVLLPLSVAGNSFIPIFVPHTHIQKPGAKKSVSFHFLNSAVQKQNSHIPRTLNAPTPEKRRFRVWASRSGTLWRCQGGVRGCLIPEKQRLAWSSPALDAKWEKSPHGKALFPYME